MGCVIVLNGSGSLEKVGAFLMISHYSWLKSYMFMEKIMIAAIISSFQRMQQTDKEKGNLKISHPLVHRKLKSHVLHVLEWCVCPTVKMAWFSMKSYLSLPKTKINYL